MPFPFRFFVIVFACFVPIFLVGTVFGSEMIRYAGATTIQRDFMGEAALRFSAVHDVKFQVEGGNSGAGLKALSAGVVDLAGSGRFLSKKETGAGLIEHLLGWDPLVVVVHASNPMENISTEDLQRLISGQSRNWNQVGGRDLPILQVVAPQGSGVHDAVEDLFLGDKHFSPQAIVSLVVADADKNVALFPAAFTVTSLSMVDVVQVKIIKVNHFLPTRQSVDDGKYPLIKPLLLVTKGKPKGLLALFVNFAKSTEGQAIVAKKFVPLI